MAPVESKESGLPPFPTIILPDDIHLEEEDDDVYRGLPDDQPPVTQQPIRLESSPSALSLSSSSAYSTPGRIGTLAAVVEKAITRWAKRNSSSSSINTSSSSSSSSSAPSIQTKSTRKRRRHNAEHNARSERDIIARIKVRQETRRIPRGFSLYVPPQLRTTRTGASTSEPVLQYDQQGVLRTHLLPAVLHRVQYALHLLEKGRKPEQFVQGGQTIQTIDSVVDTATSSSSMADGRRRGKEKERDLNRAPEVNIPRPILEPSWWLDVSSPTYADMKALGKLLHLHPLTLEDILHQDPREKMEIFPKLGYYFIVFKAVESERTRDRLDRLARRQSMDTLVPVNTGALSEALIYLVVLRDGRGICTFHFTDISDHLDRVREKVLLLDENKNKSPEWIAYGILDSVVDSFFPLLAKIEKEVNQIEKSLFSDPEVSEAIAKASPTGPKPLSDSSSEPINEKGDDSDAYDEKPPQSLTELQEHDKTAEFEVPSSSTSQHTSRTRKFLVSLFPRNLISAEEPRVEQQVNPVARTVDRIAKVRRLVTSLARLLSTKTEVIAQIRKRLVTRGEWSLDNDRDLHIHLGDILDHILSLQQALVHFEQMLVHSHPIYLSQLQIYATKSKGGHAKAVFILSVVSMGILIVLVPIGVMSMNVGLPHNGRAPQYPLYAFGGVVLLVVLTACAYLTFVRQLWKNAKKRTRKSVS